MIKFDGSPPAYFLSVGNCTIRMENINIGLI